MLFTKTIFLPGSDGKIQRRRCGSVKLAAEEAPLAELTVNLGTERGGAGEEHRTGKGRGQKRGRGARKASQTTPYLTPECTR